VIFCYDGVSFSEIPGCPAQLRIRSVDQQHKKAPQNLWGFVETGRLSAISALRFGHGFFKCAEIWRHSVLEFFEVRTACRSDRYIPLPSVFWRNERHPQSLLPGAVQSGYLGVKKEAQYCIWLRQKCQYDQFADTWQGLGLSPSESSLNRFHSSSNVGFRKVFLTLHSAECRCHFRRKIIVLCHNFVSIHGEKRQEQSNSQLPGYL